VTAERFPEDFVFGAATSAYQIEGAWNENGKGESIWDRFTHTPGMIEDGTAGDVACDHVHRWREDVELMAQLGLDAYRFSISWPRVLRNGRGSANAAGIAFYDRLVDALLERGIEPYVTLYHWDLPQAIQDAGGWPARESVEAFCEYTQTVARALGDRVKHWITLNEPFVSAFVGYHEGQHAPGHTSEREALAATHHLLLAHGRSMSILRETVSEAHVGIVLNLHPVIPASSSEHDRFAAERLDGLINRTYLDPLTGRGYPGNVPYDHGTLNSFVRAEDLAEIAAPLDFLGVNYYFRHVVRSKAIRKEANAPREVDCREETTDMGWEVYPEGLFELLERLHRDYGFPGYVITENGAAYADRVNGKGHVHDPDRISYLSRHLEQAHRALSAKIPLRGYFVWSLLDNFEWAHGLKKRFGLIYVDFATGMRIPKASYEWYRRAIARRTVEPIDS
jgi:beta-glucosidase